MQPHRPSARIRSVSAPDASRSPPASARTIGLYENARERMLRVQHLRQVSGCSFKPQLSSGSRRRKNEDGEWWTRLYRDSQVHAENRQRKAEAVAHRRQQNSDRDQCTFQPQMSAKSIALVRERAGEPHWERLHSGAAERSGRIQSLLEQEAKNASLCRVGSRFWRASIRGATHSPNRRAATRSPPSRRRSADRDHAILTPRPVAPPADSLDTAVESPRPRVYRAGGPLCPQGHVLRMCYGAAPAYPEAQCDHCFARNLQLRIDGFGHCTPCEYDVCGACMRRRASPRSPPRRYPECLDPRVTAMRPRPVGSPPAGVGGEAAAEGSDAGLEQLPAEGSDAGLEQLPAVGSEADAADGSPRSAEFVPEGAVLAQAAGDSADASPRSAEFTPEGAVLHPPDCADASPRADRDRDAESASSDHTQPMLRPPLRVGATVVLNRTGQTRFDRRGDHAERHLRPGELGSVQRVGRQRHGDEGHALTALVLSPRGAAHLYWQDELAVADEASSDAATLPNGSIALTLSPDPSMLSVAAAG
eukprot:TRINITY_DN13966_c0_g1_i1.p1 TRINITY_DN13966_c0_g1~~TRINITY_DN13966_c0_g1_i1.p1  ORF type:complete len:533 (+),score=183.92 TRINITY_DN13966_c0_g1_i1:68-1666(+)